MPDAAGRAFTEACDNIKRGNFSTAVILTRKTLDIATTELTSADTKSSPDNLKERINKLCNKGMITREMKIWADEIRYAGNIAVHEEDAATKEDAEQLIAFTELFLIYSFTLPLMVKERQTARKLTGNLRPQNLKSEDGSHT
ncbi:DUF4145 domain-containing protein [Escherichia coli O134:H31]